ncbi:MAG: preprotein translocase subunit SecA [Firmicutes bacterium ADurb.Bin419]|nr:MAG: preprotein translocase subunit SecA [Firmicutes bacterium ADurb.Bin419]
MLIGTISIEKSELLSSILKKRGIRHQVLNAKYHEKEAEIIAQAGEYGAVTIATNMAGRGTDIKLGIGVVDAGGLAIIGTERHDSRRVDRQLRGRAGRQGDPGSSEFFVSLEDNLMRLFGSDRLTGIVNALGLEDDQAIEHRMLSGAIENAQKKVEGKNFGIRKNVLQYDDVMNKQREVIYSQRRKVLNGESLKDNFLKMFEGIADNIVQMYCSESPLPDYWDWESIRAFAEGAYVPAGTLNISKDEMEGMTPEKLRESILEMIMKRYEEKENEFGSELMRELERVVLLRIVDQRWMDHIDAMDQLKHGIHLRAYGQRDPVIEYKFEGFDMFEEMNRNIQFDAVKVILNTHVNREKEPPKREKVAEPIEASHGDEAKKPVVKSQKDRVGRNDLCPCGSGKKYKKCCGENA